MFRSPTRQVRRYFTGGQCANFLRVRFLTFAYRNESDFEDQTLLNDLKNNKLHDEQRIRFQESQTCQILKAAVELSASHEKDRVENSKDEIAYKGDCMKKIHFVADCPDGDPQMRAQFKAALDNAYETFLKQLSNKRQRTEMEGDGTNSKPQSQFMVYGNSGKKEKKHERLKFLGKI